MVTKAMRVFVLTALLFLSYTNIAMVSAQSAQIHRFDKELFRLIESGADSLEIEKELILRYPGMLDAMGQGLFNMHFNDSTNLFPRILNFYSEPTLKKMYQDAITLYDSISDIEQTLGEGFTFLKTHFPTLQQPVLYMHVSGFNQNVWVADNLLSLSIDRYLGSDYPLYQEFFYDYQRRKMQRSSVVPDYLTGWLLSEYPFLGKENVLLERMLYAGKLKYIIHQALPELPLHEVMGYEEEEYNWCKNNEKRLWKTVLERKHLHTPDQQITDRYFEDRPSDFLSDLAPGNIGSWIGWQIITRYMKESGSTLEAFMDNTNYSEILKIAKYKP